LTRRPATGYAPAMAKLKTASTVLVTGAAKRIGRTIALDFAAQGWRVGVHYNSSSADADQLVAEIVKAGGSAAALPADLTEAGASAELVPACAERLGAPACLINCASLFLEDHVGTLTTELWDRHFTINLRTPVMLAQSLAKHLPAAVVQGTVINIIDQRVWRPTPEFFSYSLSKSALWQATPMLAQALAPRIRVNAIAPGPVLQSIHQTPEVFAAEQAITPLGRGTTPEEIAAAIRYILSAPAMTGQMIALDGGQHLAWQPSEPPHPNGKRQS
jgi:NAD(P)-dependent dehydrogenase (short-subunit alcohol dehydrogenase family)